MCWWFLQRSSVLEQFELSIYDSIECTVCSSLIATFECSELCTKLIAIKYTIKESF